MLGFFSIFNSSHVSNASIMKSFIPAEYPFLRFCITSPNMIRNVQLRVENDNAGE